MPKDHAGYSHSPLWRGRQRGKLNLLKICDYDVKHGNKIIGRFLLRNVFTHGGTPYVSLGRLISGCGTGMRARLRVRLESAGSHSFRRSMPPHATYAEVKDDKTTYKIRELLHLGLGGSNHQN